MSKCAHLEVFQCMYSLLLSAGSLWWRTVKCFPYPNWFSVGPTFNQQLKLLNISLFLCHLSGLRLNLVSVPMLKLLKPELKSVQVYTLGFAKGYKRASKCGKIKNKGKDFLLLVRNMFKIQKDLKLKNCHLSWIEMWLYCCVKKYSKIMMAPPKFE